MVDRPFGGLNVIFCGDIWQLDPPSGTAIASIPADVVRGARQFAPAPDVKHGQELFWGKGVGHEGCVQGVTELTECMRCEDVWLRSVQEGMRAGRLSEETHAFLHGERACKPGSYTKDDSHWDAHCTEHCKKAFVEAMRMPTPDRATYIERNECEKCKEERKSRRLVAQGPEDERLREEKFQVAPAIVPNNSVKYDINKIRAHEYAASSGEGIAWCRAHDKPSQRVLQGRVHLQRDK